MPGAKNRFEHRATDCFFWCNLFFQKKRLSIIQNCPGNDLSSQAVAHQLLSALRHLTNLFGMGRSGTTAQKSPGQFWIQNRSLGFGQPRNRVRAYDMSCRMTILPPIGGLKKKKPRTISTGKLNAFLRVHLPPISSITSDAILQA